ncbi:hypothetical protein WA016_05768 [Myxococcus stipitatus]
MSGAVARPRARADLPRRSFLGRKAGPQGPWKAARRTGEGARASYPPRPVKRSLRLPEGFC